MLLSRGPSTSGCGASRSQCLPRPQFRHARYSASRRDPGLLFSAASSSGAADFRGDQAGPSGGDSSSGIDDIIASVSDEAPVLDEEGKMPHRWIVVAAMVAAFVLCNMDKVNMSVAVIPMAKELGWSATDRGLVSSAFFYGYAFTQIPAGYICTKIGGTKVLLGGVVLWSLGTLVAPPLAEAGLLWLCLSRVFVGLGEGFAPSAVTSIMARLIPERERSRAVSTVFGGLDLGSVIGLLLSGPIIASYGWPSVFYVFGVLGLTWAVIWPFCSPDRVDPTMQAEQRATDAARSKVLQGRIDSGTATSSDDSAVPYGKFLATPAVWAVIVAHFCFNWGYYTLLAWLPSYFELALGLQVTKSSFLTLVPYAAMVVMTPFVGPVADGLVKRGWTVTNVRKLCQGISFAGPAACMLLLSRLSPVSGGVVTQQLTGIIVVIMSVAFALGAWSRAGLYCAHQDMSPKFASALLGLSNTAGALPGVLGVSAAGYLLDKTAGNWALAIFLPTACVQLFGLIIYSKFADSTPRPDW